MRSRCNKGQIRASAGKNSGRRCSFIQYKDVIKSIIARVRCRSASRPAEQFKTRRSTSSRSISSEPSSQGFYLRIAQPSLRDFICSSCEKSIKLTGSVFVTQSQLVIWRTKALAVMYADFVRRSEQMNPDCVNTSFADFLMLDDKTRFALCKRHTCWPIACAFGSWVLVRFLLCLLQLRGAARSSRL